jgi:membrane protein DedA with SNARE-associated domain
MGRLWQETLKKSLGQSLIIFSFAFYGCLLLVPFAPFSAGSKMLLSTILVISGEASFWIAVLILGRGVVSKYRNFDWRKWLEEHLGRPGRTKKGP